MSKIKRIILSNFKFFGKEESIELGGKHLLLYGENGSGKSSIYWALYTMLEAATKTPLETGKYFTPIDQSDDSLVNIHAVPMSDLSSRKEHYDSFVNIECDNGTKYSISLIDTSICGCSDVKESQKASDFINYQALYKFQNFKNSQDPDLFDIFVDTILPYVSFGSFHLKGKNITNAHEMWVEIEDGPGKTINAKGHTIQVYKSSQDYKDFEAFVYKFNKQFENLINEININAQKYVKDLGYDMEFLLKYVPASFKKKDVKYDCDKFKVMVSISSYDNTPININRPHKLLNEAKMAAIAIAIRLSVIDQRLNSAAEGSLKVLLLDDIMISLDMSNRDKLLDLILKKFTDKYQILFLTHDKLLFSFVSEKIDKYGQHSDWKRNALFIGEDDRSNAQYPLFPTIIDEDCDSFEKAKKYFQAKDYVASALYIRQSLEKYINDQLPKEYTATVDGKPLSLNQLWGRMIKYSDKIPQDLKDIYDQSRLMILNPAVHYNVSFPIYRRELQQAFKLVEELRKITIISPILLLPKGAKLEFTHPSIPYVFCIETLQDMWKGEAENPNCRIIYWQYDGIDFYDFITKTSKIPSNPIETRLEKIITNLESIKELGITRELFLKKTKIAEYGYLKDIIQ